MNNFKKAYLDILGKHRRNPEDEKYYVQKIKNYEKVKIGVSDKGLPSILIDATNEDPIEQDLPPLSGIKASFGIDCEVSETSSSIKSGLFNIIEFIEEDLDLLDFFFNFFEDLFEDDKNKSANKIRSSIINLSKLFSHRRSPPRRTMMGLWSELFIMTMVENTDVWAEKWHPSNRATFDYKFPVSGIDVKSFGGHNREHFFQIEQLNNDSVEQTLILSMCLKENEEGINIFNLLEELRTKLTKKMNISKIQKLLFKLAGKEINNAKCFNEKIAKSTLLLLRGKDIPSLNPKHTPQGVSEIKFKSDCSAVKGLKFDSKTQKKIEENILL